MDYIATDFTSTGTHDVRVTVYRGEREQERVFGSTTWTVHVEEGAGEAPRADRVSPEDREVEVPEDNTVAFTLRASDPDGDLHRVVWWEGVCDDVMKIDVVNGSEVRSSGTFDVEEECPFFAWVVDERGHRTTSESWRPVDERETDGPRHTLAVTKEGAPDGKARFSVTVSGDLEPADDFEDPGSDSIDGDTATGVIGPESGTDTVRYSGEITAFSLEGPAVVYLDGGRVDPETLG